MNGERRSRRMMRWAGRLFAVGGASLLAYCGFVLWEAREFQQQESLALDSIAPLPIKPENPAAIGVRTVPGSLPVAIRRAPGLSGGLIGRVEVPRLDLSAIVIEGSDSVVLQRAVGHVPGTALPGESGNIAITGHRDTFFRPLRNIRQADLIRFTTPKEKFWYRVTSISVVAPDDVAVLGAGKGEELTMITCFPFSFVGAAPRRFVVRAERVGS